MTSGRADYTNLTLVKGIDVVGNPLTILLDNSGGLYAVMKGGFDEELKTIRVDEHGRMEARMIYPDAVYDFETGVTAFCVTQAGGKDTFMRRYVEDQTDLAVIEAVSGYKIQINGVYMSTESNIGEALLDFSPSKKPIFSLYASKYARDSAHDIAITGELLDSVILNTTTGDNGFTLMINYRKVLPIDPEYTHLTTIIFLTGTPTGTAASPQRINDGAVDMTCLFYDIGEYIDVELDAKYYVKQYRTYGTGLNVGDGYFKLQYYDDDISAWIDLDTNIPTRGASWSSWMSLPLTAVQNIRLVCTKVDTGSSGSRIAELEMKYS